jgi:hypothetical protein
VGSPQPGKMDVTLVAYYGDKPPLIAKLIEDTISKLSKVLGSGFIPYSLPQVHGTIIGLEGRRVNKQIINANYAEKLNELRLLDLNAALQSLKDESILPFDVTIGGFTDRGQYSFTSRELVPYLRSFSIQGLYAVAMGWPYTSGEYSELIDKLRRVFNSANILHKYHNTPQSEDNDFFFVLGNIVKENIDQIQLQEAQGALRSFLALYDPVRVPISRDTLSIVAYVDTKLPLDTSCCYTLDDAEEKIDEIKSLYREVNDITRR